MVLQRDWADYSESFVRGTRLQGRRIPAKIRAERPSVHSRPTAPFLAVRTLGIHRTQFEIFQFSGVSCGTLRFGSIRPGCRIRETSGCNKASMRVAQERHLTVRVA